MAIAVKLKGQAGQFRSEAFTPTKWAAADEKAKIANKLTRFVLGGLHSFFDLCTKAFSNHS